MAAAAAAPEHPKVSRKRGGKQADGRRSHSLDPLLWRWRSFSSSSLPRFLRAPASPSLLPSPLPPTSASVRPSAVVRRSSGFSRMAIIFHGPLDGRFQAPTAANADSTERPTAARRCNVVSQFVRPFSVPSISPRLVSPSLSPFPTSPVSLSSSANEALADKRGATTMLERGKGRKRGRERGAQHKAPQIY